MENYRVHTLVWLRKKESKSQVCDVMMEVVGVSYYLNV